MLLTKLNLKVNTMCVILREVRSGKVCKIFAMGTDRDCPLHAFLGELKRHDEDEFARLDALLQRTADHGTVKNEEKYRYFKKEKVFEFKTRGGVRVIAFWDENQVIICSHGFLKKKQKTPKKELERAVIARGAYFGAKAIDKVRVE